MVFISICASSVVQGGFFCPPPPKLTKSWALYKFELAPDSFPKSKNL